MTEARLVESESGGLIPEGEGWFVLNAKAARWLSGGPAAPAAQRLNAGVAVRLSWFVRSIRDVRWFGGGSFTEDFLPG